MGCYAVTPGAVSPLGASPAPCATPVWHRRAWGPALPHGLREDVGSAPWHFLKEAASSSDTHGTEGVWEAAHVTGSGCGVLPGTGTFCWPHTLHWGPTREAEVPCANGQGLCGWPLSTAWGPGRVCLAESAAPTLTVPVAGLRGEWPLAWHCPGPSRGTGRRLPMSLTRTAPQPQRAEDGSQRICLCSVLLFVDDYRTFFMYFF